MYSFWILYEQEFQCLTQNRERRTLNTVNITDWNKFNIDINKVLSRYKIWNLTNFITVEFFFFKLTKLYLSLFIKYNWGDLRFRKWLIRRTRRLFTVIYSETGVTRDTLGDPEKKSSKDRCPLNTGWCKICKIRASTTTHYIQVAWYRCLLGQGLL